MTSHKVRAALMLGANLVILVAMRPALAADASPWDGSERAAMRLIAGGPARADDQAIYRATLSRSPCTGPRHSGSRRRSEEHTSELQSRPHLVCRLLCEIKK